MGLIFLAVGFALGCTITLLINSRCKIYGVIEVDHDTEQCKVRITSNELSNRKSKKAIFVIKHDVKISRDEQGL